MADADRVRLEIAFEGNQVLTVYVPPPVAADLDRAMTGEHETLSFDAEDGRYTVAASKIVWLKLFARESRVGFGADG
jgi:hypothetical protein